MDRLINNPKFQAFDDNGDLLSGGKVYTYVAGTVTPLTTYSDRTLSTPNSNPVILDNRGEALIFCNALLKTVLKDSDDVPVTGGTVDNLKPTDLTDLSDDDGDTAVEVEQTPDEDKIRCKTGGVERLVIDANGLAFHAIILDGTLLTVTPAEFNILDGADPDLNTFLVPANTTISAFLKTVLDDANAAGVRATLEILNDPAAGTAGLRTLGTTALKACAGNDSRLSNTRIPTNSSVSQAKLKTSTQSGYLEKIGRDSSSSTLALTGGGYNFQPRSYISAQTLTADDHYGCELGVADGTINNTSATAYIRLTIYSHDSGQWARAHYDCLYVTASGEVHWVFILRDKKTKQIISMWQAPDHPCFRNGGNSLLIPHPFGNYDESKHEIIVVNPTNEEIEQMELETVVDDETKSDKDLLEVIAENYEIDENSSPAWPDKEVTVGLPKHVKDKKTGKKILADYRFMAPDTVIEPIRKQIPKPDYIKVKKLKRK